MKKNKIIFEDRYKAVRTDLDSLISKIKGLPIQKLKAVDQSLIKLEKPEEMTKE